MLYATSWLLVFIASYMRESRSFWSVPGSSHAIYLYSVRPSNGGVLVSCSVCRTSCGRCCAGLSFLPGLLYERSLAQWSQNTQNIILTHGRGHNTDTALPECVHSVESLRTLTNAYTQVSSAFMCTSHRRRRTYLILRLPGSSRSRLRHVRIRSRTRN